MKTRSFETLQQLFDIMERLRKECPWDKEQTYASLMPHSIEEIYELADAIIHHDKKNIQEELGDLLMHFVFYTIIAEEQKDFELDDIIVQINNKLIFRHPHIFQEGKSLENAKAVLENWQRMKKKEGKEFALSGIAKGLPAMTKAFRIQQKASDNAFDFEQIDDVLHKVQEEQQELAQAIEQNTNIEEEFGDVLFSLINYARFLHIDPEKALQKTNEKFIQRFTAMEKILKNNNENFTSLNSEQKEDLWQAAKAQTKLS